MNDLSGLVWELRKALRTVSKINPELEQSDFTGAMQDVEDQLKDIYENTSDLKGVVYITRGNILANQFPIGCIRYLSQALWKLGGEFEEESEDQKTFRRLASHCKFKVVDAFRCALSGGEHIYRNEQGKIRHYSLSGLTKNIKESLDIKYSINPPNTQLMLQAYDQSKKEAEKEKTERMITHWEDEKEIFLFLIKQYTPRLLEVKEN